MEFYKIRSKGVEYYLSRLREQDRDTLSFGGKKKCVVIHVEHGKPCGYMSIAQVDEKCNLNGDLRRESGTIHLIKVAMKVTCDLYKHLNGKFNYDDKSSIYCEGDIVIRLPHYYWAVHGKTWYEKHLNAYPLGSHQMDEKAIEITYKEALRTLKKKFTTKPDLAPYIATMKKSKQTYLLAEYEKAKDLKAFVLGFSRKGLDCSVYEKWLYQIVSSCMEGFDTILWQMECDKTTNVDEATLLSDEPKDIFMVGGYKDITYIFKGDRLNKKKV